MIYINKDTESGEVEEVPIADLPIKIMKRLKAFKEGEVLVSNGGIFGMSYTSPLLRLKELKIGSIILKNKPSVSHSVITFIIQKSVEIYSVLRPQFILAPSLIKLDYSNNNHVVPGINLCNKESGGSIRS